MAKTLRVRTRAGWVTKPTADIVENRLTAGEIDDTFLGLDDDKLSKSGDIVGNVRATEQFVTSGAIDALNGSVVTITLSAPVTLSIANFSSGSSMLIHIINGNLHAVDFSAVGVSWHVTPPEFSGSIHTVALEKSGSTVYGYDCGYVV